MDDAAGMADEGRGIGGEKHLALADPEHYRAAVAGDDDHVGVCGVEDGEPVGPADQPERRAHRGIERSRRHRRDQVCEHLGVGLRAKDDPIGFEPGAQLSGILDDAVMDDGDPVLGIAMRMGIAVARLAMRCPARMGDAGRALEARRQQLFELAHPALAFGQTQLAAAGDRDPGRIVAAIFEPMQPFDQDRRRVAPADVTDDATHARVSSAIDDPAQLPLAVGRRAKPPMPQLRHQPRKDFGVR